MWTNQRLDRLRHVSARDKIFAVLLNQREAQPTARTVNHCLAAAAYKFERMLLRFEFHFVTCRRYACGHSIKLRDVVDGQVIVTAYFDDLPFAGSKCCYLRYGDADGDEY